MSHFRHSVGDLVPVHGSAYTVMDTTDTDTRRCYWVTDASDPNSNTFAVDRPTLDARDALIAANQGQ